MFSQQQKNPCVLSCVIILGDNSIIIFQSNEQTCFSKNCKLEKLKIHSFALINKMEKQIIGQHLTNLVPHINHFTFTATCTTKVLKVD